MGASWLRALIPLVGLTVNAVSQVLVFRLVPRVGMWRSLLIGLTVGIVAAAGLELWLDWRLSMPIADRLSLLAANLLACAALGYCYFHFVNLGETARRIRILRELLEAGGSLSEADLLAHYSAEEMVRLRIARLMDNGQLAQVDGRYLIARRALLRSARIILRLKRLVLGKASEFD
jgi:hypothetical protein